jgi:hypothetical protein
VQRSLAYFYSLVFTKLICLLAMQILTKSCLFKCTCVRWLWKKNARKVQISFRFVIGLAFWNEYHYVQGPGWLPQLFWYLHHSKLKSNTLVGLLQIKIWYQTVLLYTTFWSSIIASLRLFHYPKLKTSPWSKLMLINFCNSETHTITSRRIEKMSRSRVAELPKSQESEITIYF